MPEYFRGRLIRRTVPAVRDYIDVVDPARACGGGRLMVGGKSRSNYEIFNVGTGRGVR